MSADESIKIAHLTMLQGVISRMATNSFTLKTLSVSFVGAWIAFLAATNEYSLFFLLAPIIPTLMFWALDTQYLKLERSYRKLYEAVRKGGSVEHYSMDFRPFTADVGSFIRVAVSWSVSTYYIVLLVLTVSVGIYLMIGEPNA